MTATDNASTDFGANSWLVDEMYEQFRADPDSVSDTWQEFFEDYKPRAHRRRRRRRRVARRLPRRAPAAAPAPPPRRRPRRAATPRPGRRRAARRARGAAADEPGRADPRRRRWPSPPTWSAASTCPTATSFRNVPAKLLEVNRKVINGYRSRTGQGKVSFTHLIGYAIVRAIADAVPNMNNTFAAGADGKPRLVRNEHVNMGLAVDVDKADGSRTLVVPVLRDADTLDFAGFLAAYEDLIRKVKAQQARRRRTSRARRSRSPTRARSAPSRACRG